MLVLVLVCAMILIQDAFILSTVLFALFIPFSGCWDECIGTLWFINDGSSACEFHSFVCFSGEMVVLFVLCGICMGILGTCRWCMAVAVIFLTRVDDPLQFWL